MGESVDDTEDVAKRAQIERMILDHAKENFSAKTMKLLKTIKTKDLASINVPDQNQLTLWLEKQLLQSEFFTAAELAEFGALELEADFSQRVIDKVSDTKKAVTAIEKINHVRHFCLEAAGLGLSAP